MGHGLGQLIGDKLEKLLQMTFHVRAEYRDADYWYCEFGMNYIDVFTQERPFMAIDAIEDERQEMMGCGGKMRRDGADLRFKFPILTGIAGGSLSLEH